MSIIVHHLENSRSFRVLWMLEEMGLSYELREYARDPKTMLAPDSLKDVHPLGKSPIVEDGALVLAESGAILEHFSSQTEKLRPKTGDSALIAFRYWLHYAEATLMPLLLIKLIFQRVVRQSPFFIRPVAAGIADQVGKNFTDPRLAENLRFIDDHLLQHRWFAGEAFSVADIQMSFPLLAASQRLGRPGTHPAIEGFMTRIQEREAWQRAEDRGGSVQILDG